MRVCRAKSRFGSDLNTIQSALYSFWQSAVLKEMSSHVLSLAVLCSTSLRVETNLKEFKKGRFTEVLEQEVQSRPGSNAVASLASQEFDHLYSDEPLELALERFDPKVGMSPFIVERGTGASRESSRSRPSLNSLTRSQPEVSLAAGNNG